MAHPSRGRGTLLGRLERISTPPGASARVAPPAPPATRTATLPVTPGSVWRDREATCDILTGNDNRAANMVAFAIAGLDLLADTLRES